MFPEIHAEHRDGIEEPEATSQVNEAEIRRLRDRISALSRSVEATKRRMLAASDSDPIDELAAEVGANQVELEHLQAQLAAMQQELRRQSS